MGAYIIVSIKRIKIKTLVYDRLLRHFWSAIHSGHAVRVTSRHVTSSGEKGGANKDKEDPEVLLLSPFGGGAAEGSTKWSVKREKGDKGQ